MNNKIMDSKELMKKIMEYGFAITDLGLYLDTHPKDTDSLMTYSSLRDTYNSLIIEYARVKGYAIDERALSGLYISIDELNGDDEGTEIEKVKKIVDSAIIKCGKSSRNFFGKKRNGLISLKEKHFLK